MRREDARDEGGADVAVRGRARRVRRGADEARVSGRLVYARCGGRGLGDVLPDRPVSDVLRGQTGGGGLWEGGRDNKQENSKYISAQKKPLRFDQDGCFLIFK